MDRLTPTLIIVGIIVVAVAGMYFGWRALVRKGAGLVAPSPVPDSVGKVVSTFAGLYVATTLAAKPFERVAAHGLGFRARTKVAVSRDGITVEFKGRDPFFIDRRSILTVQRATWAIDKAVEPGGLIVVTWRLGETELDSYFRIDGDSEEMLRASAVVIEGLQ